VQPWHDGIAGCMNFCLNLKVEPLHGHVNYAAALTRISTISLKEV
jgi:hypothetical protein